MTPHEHTGIKTGNMLLVSTCQDLAVSVAEFGLQGWIEADGFLLPGIHY